jgi:hypothetical protein
LQNVEIVVRHRTEPVVRRISQFLPAAKANSADPTNAAQPAGSSKTGTSDSGF